jgi:hypothetical protein
MLASTVWTALCFLLATSALVALFVWLVRQFLKPRR